MGCFICGEDNSVVLEEHHIVPRRYGGTDDEENLVTLCANCHSAVEKLYDKRFYRELGVADGDISITETIVTDVSELSKGDYFYWKDMDVYYRFDGGNVDPKITMLPDKERRTPWYGTLVEKIEEGEIIKLEIMGGSPEFVIEQAHAGFIGHESK